MFLSIHISLFSLISFFTLLLALISFKWLSSISKPYKNPPPSPPKLPIIGNFTQLGSIPHRHLHKLAQQYGPLMLIHLGRVPVLVASTSDAAREIMKTHDTSFCNRPKSTISHVLTYGSKDIAFSPYGEYWRQIKSIVVLKVLSSKRVQSFQRVREQETRIMIDTIKENYGCLIDLSELFVSLTNNVVCRVAVGRKYRGLKFKDLLIRLTYLLGVFDVGSYIPWLSWVSWFSGLEHKAYKVAKELDDFLEGVIEEHVKGNVNNDELKDKDQDLVDILLDLQRENASGFIFERDMIKAVMLDMLSAGTDTTSTSLEWAVSELIKHPQVMEKLQQEAREIAQGKWMIAEEDLKKMTYLKAVIKETLRLHPPAPLLVPRESTKYVKLMGYDVGAGTQVIINAWAIGRDPTLWEDAEKFKPERFLNSDIDYKGLHFEFIPFGAGRRGCPGIQFAIAVNELALANLVFKYNLVLPGGQREEEFDMSETAGLTIHRKFPLLVQCF